MHNKQLNMHPLPQKLKTVSITNVGTNNMAQGIILPLYKGMAPSHVSVQFL